MVWFVTVRFCEPVQCFSVPVRFWFAIWFVALLGYFG